MTRSFEPLFSQLKPLIAAYEGKGVVQADEPSKYYLGTREVRAKDGYRTQFGGVEIKKAYVSFHLMPVYAHPDLLKAISPALKKRMQGKSCFNFKEIDKALLGELQALTEAGFKVFEKKGRFTVKS